MFIKNFFKTITDSCKYTHFQTHYIDFWDNLDKTDIYYA